ncbi:MAG TPA: PIN domain-containing protein [Pseudonocardiaceae bacterium]|jgi:predicted nucleic acid-binding protein|nr:PIN domain-containing protein [Pseudonocardiaceae bacterium]
MSTLVLDTTVLIDALRGRPAAARLRDLAARREVLLTTAINVEEIVRGLRPGEHAAADALFTAIRVLPVREHDARRAGLWRREHAARGVTLHQADCLIGAVTAGIGARLATGNAKDFPMPEVPVEEWPPGS